MPRKWQVPGLKFGAYSADIDSMKNAVDSLYRLLVQSVTDCAVTMLGLDGRIGNWNAGAAQMTGYAADEIVGRQVTCLYTSEDCALGVPQRDLRTALESGRFAGEAWRVRKDGSHFWAHVTAEPVQDDAGATIGFAIITRNQSEAKRQTDDLASTREHLELALANMLQGLCVFDAQERLVFLNPRYAELLELEGSGIGPGWTFADQLRAMHSAGAGTPEQREAGVQEERERHLAQVQVGHRSLETVHRGRSLVVHHRALPGGGWVTTLADVTERRTIERRIVHMAQHDALTELPNRGAFHDVLSGYLAGGNECALLYIDLDRFKPVNDSLGHAAGDEVLRLVAERIRAELRMEDISARLGGDEFAVLLPNSGEPRAAAEIASRLIAAISRPLQIRGTEASIGASVGVALAPLHGQNADGLLRSADLALYAAKAEGRGRSRIYEIGMEHALRERCELESDLRGALAAGQLSVVYQPVTNTLEHSMRSVEALLRWTHPVRGSISPAVFIPIAEEIGLMPEIGDWVLQTACTEATLWPEDVAVAVNLSTTQFCLPDLVQRVLRVLRATGLPARRLELEVTETAMIKDLAGATEMLGQLRACGIQVALDDFGTGYSSLSFLRTLPFTRIKIDRSFTQDLGSRPAAAAIVRAVTGLCSSLGVAATAEGVETAEQLAMLQNEGCDEVQGYLISRPISAADLRIWMHTYRSEHEALRAVEWMEAQAA